MRQVSLPCFHLPEDFLLRLEPVIQSPLADASFIELERSLGNLLMKLFRQKYLNGCLGAGSSTFSDLFRLFRLHGSLPDIHSEAGR